MGASESRRERKVVTVVFADLVGFTGRAETLDPEDVDAILRPYHDRLRAELERRGGTVEKFIGDAVMAVFGAPAAHEDDPERAVRAALAIRDATSDSDLQVRIAVNTGEALVSLGARPSEGEGMVAGDVVNTAARLQAAAPVNGVLVGEATWRATRDSIDYRESDPVEAKGKAEPVRVWEAVQARAAFGVDVETRPGTPLVGRQSELDVLRDALARVRREREQQLVTLVGVPGIGKSRLVSELFAVVDAEPALIHWRQGRSLPYGDASSFWAFGEMVKAQAGILDSDAAGAAEEKLAAAVAAVVDDDADWVRSHLLPLVGLARDGVSGGDTRGETFAAWRRFVEGLAEQRPLVLVFEDLHWADDGLLDFIDHLVDWASGVPLLVVCTARPELLTRRPGWGGGKSNATALSLSPLSGDDTARLVSALFGQAVLPADLQAALLARADGNPLYAEEYVRMLQDRDLLRGSGELDDIPLPETVQGLIASRLDALSPEEKELAQNAAVLGKVFWPGALAALGGGTAWELEECLHALERKQFARRERRSAVAGETQYAFLHLLVRDVAYGQIPRGPRAEKHRAAAGWIEGLSSDRSEDRSEMLAHHYLAALELAAAAGIDASDLREPARLALRDAGDRAAALFATSSAARFYERARELWPEDDADLGLLLLHQARTLYQLDAAAGVRAGEEAAERLEAIGRAGDAAEALLESAISYFVLGQRDAADARVAKATALLADQPASRAKAVGFVVRARLAALAGHVPEAVSIAREGLALVEELGLEELRSNLLNTLGMARTSLGELEGMADLEESLAIATRLNAADDIRRAYNNLGSKYFDHGRLDRAREMNAAQQEAAMRFGSSVGLRWANGESAALAYVEGSWDEAVRGAEVQLDEVDAGFASYLEPALRRVLAKIKLARGDVAGAEADTARSLELGRLSKDPQMLIGTLAVRGNVLLANGRRSEAAPLATEIGTILREPGTLSLDGVIDAAWLHADLGLGGELGKLAERDDWRTPWLEASRAIAEGSFARAADVLGEIGARSDEAYARLRAGDEANVRRALEFYRSVDATAYVREAETLLAPSRSA